MTKKPIILIPVLFLLFLPIAFGIDQKSCEENGKIWFENKCYSCDGFLTKEENNVICKICNEGFIRIGNQCIQVEGNTNIFDKFINRFFPNNPMMGFLVLLLVPISGFIVFNNRKEILKNINKFRKRWIYD